MSRINFAFGVLVLPLALFSAQAQTGPMPDPGTAVVSGVVTLKGETLCGLSDDRGVYRFWGLAPGNYIVFTNSNIAGSFACPSNELRIYRLSSTSEKATEVTVTSGVETNGIDIRYREDQGRIK